MNVKISTSNTKLGVIPSVNLPPIVTCRENCACAKGCYAMKGRFLFKNVQESMRNNLEVYLTNPEKYFKEISEAISNKMMTHKFFRWHSAGDIVDEAYLDGMIDLALLLPETNFLAFTKKYELVNKKFDCTEIPANLKIIFSAWGNDISSINPHSLPVAYVRFNDEEKDKYIPLTANECSGKCTECLSCWGISNGESVVFNKH